MQTFAEFRRLSEIERLPASEFPGGKSSLYYRGRSRGEIYPLPTHPGFGYNIRTQGSRPLELILNLFDLDPRQHGFLDKERAYTEQEKNSPTFTPLIGELITTRYTTMETKDNPIDLYEVDSVILDEQPVYRNKGLGLAMYKQLLGMENIALVAGAKQTPAGRAVWNRLAMEPNILVEGLLSIPDYKFDEDEEVADSLFGKIGVDYVGVSIHTGQNDEFSVRFFTFPVTATQTKEPQKKFKELMAVANHPWTRIYTRDYSMGRYEVSLIARKK